MMKETSAELLCVFWDTKVALPGPHAHNDMLTREFVHMWVCWNDKYYIYHSVSTNNNISQKQRNNCDEDRAQQKRRQGVKTDRFLQYRRENIILTLTSRLIGPVRTKIKGNVTPRRSPGGGCFSCSRQTKDERVTRSLTLDVSRKTF